MFNQNNKSHSCILILKTVDLISIFLYNMQWGIAQRDERFYRRFF